MSYRYSVLRFVPDSARGEFVNFGAIAGDDESGDWELRLIQNLRRAKAIDDHSRLGIALAFADVIEAHIAALDRLPETGAERMSAQLLERWADEMQNVVQVSRPAPIVAQSATNALDIVFSEHVVDPTARQFRFEKKHRAVTETKRAYRRHHVPDDAVAQRILVESGPYDGMFDFAIVNGRVLQLVHCWSFQLPDQAGLAEEVKAWAWMVSELRKQGGRVRIGDREVPVPRGLDVEVASVYIPPSADQAERRAFVEAEAVFVETGVRAYLPEDADRVAQSAALRLSGAQADGG